MADAPEEHNACIRALLLHEASILVFSGHWQGLSISNISMSSYKKGRGVVPLAVCRQPADGLLGGMLEMTGDSSGLIQAPVRLINGRRPIFSQATPITIAAQVF